MLLLSDFRVILALLLLQNISLMCPLITKKAAAHAAAFLNLGLMVDRLPDRVELSHGFFEISLNAVEDSHGIVVVMDTVRSVVADKF